MSRAVLFLFLASVAALGCRNDPVPQAIIDGLPADSTPNGPLHRAGEPCLACHDSYGGAAPFVFGGTVYSLDATTMKLLPVPNIRVSVLDSSGPCSTGQPQTPGETCGATLKACSNGAGNFYVEAAGVTPVTFPLTPTAGGVAMQSLIGRDGSCATCHQLPAPGSTVTGASHDSAGVIIVDPAQADPTCNGG
jgi:hypothetical protein